MKHLSTREKRKQIVIPLVVVSERGWWLNRVRVRQDSGCVCGVVGCVYGLVCLPAPDRSVVSRTGVGASTGVGESPVGEDHGVVGCVCPE